MYFPIFFPRAETYSNFGTTSLQISKRFLSTLSGRIDSLEQKLQTQELQHKTIVSNLEKELKNVEARAQSLLQQLHDKEDIEKNAIEGLFAKNQI
jgi:SMC interacting uncharacterized protein involved in chromosome segregation